MTDMQSEDLTIQLTKLHECFRHLVEVKAPVLKIIILNEQNWINKIYYIILLLYVIVYVNVQIFAATLTSEQSLVNTFIYSNSKLHIKANISTIFLATTVLLAHLKEKSNRLFP